MFKRDESLKVILEKLGTTDKAHEDNDDEEDVTRTNPEPKRTSRAQHVLKPSRNHAWLPKSCRINRKKVVRLVLEVPSRIPSFNPIILSCCAEEVRISHSVGVASSSSMVDKQYVAAASWLYTKVWAGKWIGHAKRLMLTPNFSKDVLSSKITQKEILKTHNSQLNPCNAAELNSVFVPVSSFEKWWAICFSFNRKEIRLIDPTAILVKSQREDSMKMAKMIGKLVVGLPKDEMISSWPCIEVKFNNPCEKLSSGALMLVVIKDFAVCMQDQYDGAIGEVQRS